MRDFSRLLENTKCKSVSEITDFPAKTFRELESAEKSGALSLGVDRTAANNLGSSVHGPLYSIWIFSLMIAPFVVAVIVPIWGAYAGRYLLVFAAPVALTATFFANPHNPSRRGMTLIGFVAFVIFCIAVSLSWVTAAWLLFAFTAPIWTVRTLYRTNAEQLLAAVRQSEPLFLFLYERGVCTVRDNTTGQEYSGRTDEPSR